MKSWRYRFAAAAIFPAVVAGVVSAASPADEQQAAAAAVEAQQKASAPAKATSAGWAKAWDSLGMRGFSVALVLGDLTGTSTPDNLPPGAKKALSDMREFLPYKSYQLLDTHWLLCCSGVQNSVSGRLRGIDEDEYFFDIDARPARDGSDLAVRFNLRQAGSVEGSAHAELVREREELERQLQEMRSIGREEQHPEMTKTTAQLATARARIAELETLARARAANAPSKTMNKFTSRAVLNSTFSMKVGETVVIGTSRLKGDKALIALLTAASRNSAPSEKR